MSEIIDEAIRHCLHLCDAGFSRHERGLYSSIEAELVEVQPHVTDQAMAAMIESALRLARSGPSLISPRFAYPHIASALRPLVGEVP